MKQSQRLDYLVKELLKEDENYSSITVPDNIPDKLLLLRGLMNLRLPKPISEEFLAVQDEFLQEEIRDKGITSIDEVTPICEGLYLWQGDITTLKVDAIVNAANSGMTGCYVPNHGCIDNCIHFYSGIQLREECSRIMEKQGCEEATGQAKLTPSYNLPCDYIIHTVGPIVHGLLTEKDCKLLKRCYKSVLALAEDNKVESIAFCCISTGEFHFPNLEAAKIAIKSVKKFLKTNKSVKRVVFNVYKDTDKEIYDKLLRKNIIY